MSHPKAASVPNGFVRLDSAPPAYSPAPRVVTWLRAEDRGPVTAAAGRAAVVTHRATLAELAADVAAGRAEGVLICPALLNAGDPAALARCVASAPHTTFAGVLTATDATHDRTPPGRLLAAVHRLGGAGVGTLIDCAAPNRWGALRAAFFNTLTTASFHRRCVAAVLAEVYGTTAGGHPILPAGRRAQRDALARLFGAVFAPTVTRSGQVADLLGVQPTTFICRCFRAGLPSPKTYIAWARVVWAARLGESGPRTTATLVTLSGYESATAFRRTVRRVTGLSVAALRERHSGTTMLAWYCAVLVTPHRDRLRAFDPCGSCRRSPAPASTRRGGGTPGASPGSWRSPAPNDCRAA